MNNLFPTPLGLKVALAISGGGVLVRHPLYRDEAPHAYSDITNAEADNQKILPEDKAATQPATQAATRRTSYWELLRSWEVFKFRIGRGTP